MARNSLPTFSRALGIQPGPVVDVQSPFVELASKLEKFSQRAQVQIQTLQKQYIDSAFSILIVILVYLLLPK